MAIMSATSFSAFAGLMAAPNAAVVSKKDVDYHNGLRCRYGNGTGFQGIYDCYNGKVSGLNSSN